MITVRLRADQQDNMKLQITSVDGKTIAMNRIENRGGVFYKEINLQDVEPGMYLISVFADGGMISKRFIVE
jgi:hypothetical protein